MPKSLTDITSNISEVMGGLAALAEINNCKFTKEWRNKLETIRQDLYDIEFRGLDNA